MMQTKMGNHTILFSLLLVVASSVTGRADPAVPQQCTQQWEIDWQRTKPNFSNVLFYPGVINLGDVTISFSEVLDFIGQTWHAKSPVETIGLICTHYGPYFDVLIPGNTTVQNSCNNVVSSLANSKQIDLVKRCQKVFETFQVENVAATKLIDNIATYIDNDYLDFFQFNNDNYSDYNYSNYNYDINTTKHVFEQAIQNFTASNGPELSKLASRFAFSLLDWLGPSPFSGDIYGACSALRIASGMRIGDIVDELKSMVSDVIAESLKYFSNSGGCDVFEETIRQTINRALFWKKPDLCAFFESNPMEDDFMRKADEIIDTILSIPAEKEQCLNFVAVLTEILSTDEIYLFHMVTKFDISSAGDQQLFCAEVTDSLSPRSQHTPSIYAFPKTENISYWNADEPGELLSNFYFTDAVDVLGAVLRSETVIEGGNVVCTVFESFLTDYEVLRGDGNVVELCRAFNNSDHASIERLCRREILSDYYPFPMVRTPTLTYVTVIGIDAMRQLFELKDVSSQSVCEALNMFFYSENNLQTVTRVLLRSLIAALLPIANDFCGEYDSVLKEVQDDGNELIFFDIYNLISNHFGFSDNNTMCRSFSDGIDRISGRATEEKTTFFLTEMLQFLTDEERCAQTVDAGKLLLDDCSYQDAKFYFRLITGNSTTEELCSSIVSSFADKCLDATDAKDTTDAAVTADATQMLRLCSPFVMFVTLITTIVLRT